MKPFSSIRRSTICEKLSSRIAPRSGAKLPVKERAFDCVLTRDGLDTSRDIFSVLPELAPGDVLVKGANAVYLPERQAGVLIGSELSHPALKNLSIIAANYTAAPQCTGSLALIGPLRMDYPRIVSTLISVADIVGGSLAELLDI